MAIALSCLSGIFLFLSYPPFNLGFFAWAAFLPLFFAIRKAQSARAAFGCGFFSGAVFFFVSLQWLVHVTAIGWLLLTAFESLFFGLFSILIFFGVRPQTAQKGQTPKGPLGSDPFWWFSTACAWTATEFLRAKFPILGFGWNLLGYSQAFYPLILQSANTVGVYGLGWVIMGINSLLFQIYDKRLMTSDKGPKKSLVTSHWSVVISLFILFILIMAHGYYHLKYKGTHQGDLRISVVQGNIPQSVKWEVMARDKILEIYSTLTELAHFEEPSLIIWPEAAFPGYFNRDGMAAFVRQLVRKTGTPLLLGSPHLEGKEDAYNSAYLLGPEGEIKTRYDKQNLVPFGEYVPAPFFDWLAPYAYTLGVSDFKAGNTPTVFEILNREFKFSTLICFEDIFPELAKEFVDQGAQFLTVMTNDAWFGQSGAPAQHLQASIFRAVENGVPLVRSANTGISAFISNRGEILGKVQDKKGNPLFVTGQKTLSLPIEQKQTLFRQGGWVFPYAASAVFVIMAAFVWGKGKRKNRNAEK